MQSGPSHGGDLSQVSAVAPLHRSRVPDAASVVDRIDPASCRTRGMYSALNASSVGLELGLSVLIGVLFGRFLDSELGTEPWMMLLWLAIGFAAGFRGVLRAVRRADREAGVDG
jgi:F0F1-type ATP synthase assembly protein I